MLLDFSVPGRLVVRKEVTDPRFSNDDSWFLHRVKKALIAKGYYAIKKLAWKDGNLVDDHMHYVRDRKNKWFVYDSHYALRSIAHEFDVTGEVSLHVGGEFK